MSRKPRVEGFKWQRPKSDANAVRTLIQLVQQLANKHHIPGELEARHFVHAYLAVASFFGTTPQSSNFKDRYLMRAMLEDEQTELVQEIVRIARYEFLCGPLIPWPFYPYGNVLHMRAIENRDHTQPTRLEIAVVETVERLLAEMRIELPTGSISHLVYELPAHRRGFPLVVANQQTAEMLGRLTDNISPKGTQIMNALAAAYGRRPFKPLPKVVVAAG